MAKPLKRVGTTRPGTVKPPAETDGKHKCCCCGKEYTRQKNNFSVSHSAIYRGVNGYLPVCNHCMDYLYEHYVDVLGSSEAAIRRLCMKFDIYWHRDLFAMAVKHGGSSRIRSYISKTNLMKYVNKTYDDTILEENPNPLAALPEEEEVEIIYEEDALPKPADFTVEERRALMDFWGAGFSDDFLKELDSRYQRWTENIPTELDTAEVALYKQICLKEAEINRNIIAGKPTDNSVNSLNNLLGSLNQKPSQKKQDEAKGDALLDSTSFGVGIRMFENSRPIPEPLPELEDVDGIKRYISIWFIFDRPHIQQCVWSTL